MLTFYKVMRKALDIELIIARSTGRSMQSINQLSIDYREYDRLIRLYEINHNARP